MKKTISGLLILPFIGLAITPLFMYVNFEDNIIPIFTDGTWERLTDPLSKDYNEYWSWLIIFRTSSDAFIMLSSLFLLYLFLQKSHHLPRLMIIFIAMNVIINYVEYKLAKQISEMNPSLNPTLFALLGAIIWIPYFKISKKVKQTFSKQNEIT
ncbi:DUF2569 domain-containing protein [Candidatus Uabimicrobium sp. HlEnr_7]|uniref:DUF2569 domain-containing protein n=1 Tax=Candidatus Uabimicrobium helgolandensis TaxID=3095367 RepID=UPI003558743E